MHTAVSAPFPHYPFSRAPDDAPPRPALSFIHLQKEIFVIPSLHRAAGAAFLKKIPVQMFSGIKVQQHQLYYW